MLTTVLIILATAIVVTLVLATRLPDEFRVTRAATINAPAATVFPFITTTRGFAEWSPWAKMEPEAVLTYAGVDGTVGCSVSWEGKKTGAGTMTLVESTTPSFAKYRLDFRRPMTATNHADFRLEEKNGQTVVCWTMYGHNSYISKVVSLFMNCERMMGSQFEGGLADLKALAETRKAA